MLIGSELLNFDPKNLLDILSVLNFAMYLHFDLKLKCISSSFSSYNFLFCNNMLCCVQVTECKT